MKCEVIASERWPTLALDHVGSKARDNDRLVDVPPALLNAVQKAEHALACAELAVLEHLAKTDQFGRLPSDWLENLRSEVGSRG